MEVFSKVVDRISEVSSKAASILAMVLTLIIGYDVFMRYIFSMPTVWAYDYSIIIYGSYTMLGAAYCLKVGGHVNMDLVYARLSTRTKAIVDAVCYILLFFPLFSILTLKMWQHAVWSVKSNESGASAFSPHLGFFKVILACGFTLLLLQGVVCFLRTVKFVMRGEKHES